ncbi:MAG TPA: tol-pal system-associated acyl-CoA thioesterase [Gammaproteobacteria bacterium]
MADPAACATFVWPVRVYYEDTDSGGVVYYANYLRFLERARTEWLRALGHGQARLAAERGLLFAVREVHLDLRHPARLDDRLQVSARIAERRGASLVFQQQIVREGEPQRPLCRATIRVACLDREFRPQPLPDDLFTEASP